MCACASRASRPSPRSGSSFLTEGIGRAVRAARVCAAVLGAAAGGGGIALAQCPFTFAAPVNYPTGVHALSLAVADFNCDGVPDMAVANLGSNTVSILLGSGPSNPGTFQAAVNYPVGAGPRFVAAGDFNGDGRPDLAVANQDGNNVSILLAYPNGTFQPAVNYAVGVYPTCVAVGDFNADGRPDLAVANITSNNVSILLGNASGGFAPAVNYFIGPGASPDFVAIGDVNGDGNPDLAVSNYTSGTVTFFTGNGNGTFQAVVNQVVGTGPFCFALADLNGDGTPDLASANYGGGNVSVLLGGNPMAPLFGAAVSFDLGNNTNPTSVAVGDVTADGVPDLVAACSVGDVGRVVGLRGYPNGTFVQEFFHTVDGNNSSSIAVGDFNGDGRLDLVVTNEGSGTVSILLWCDGPPLCFFRGFDYPVTYAVGAGPTSVAVGDFDGNQFLDLAVANRNSNTVSILLGNGNGTFQAAVNYPVPVFPSSVAVLNFGRDLAVANYGSGNVSILRGDGEGGFLAAVNYPAGFGPQSVAVGDFNADGRDDLVVANNGSDTVSILLGDANGTFQVTSHYQVGDGNPNFPSFPYSVAVSDLNGDGRPDLITTNLGSNNVSILLGNGPPNAGTFQPAVNYAVSGGPESVAVGDFNADGRPDLAVANYLSHNVSVLLNASTASYPAPTIIQQPRASQNVQAGQTAGFSVIADGHGRTLTYQWRKNGVAIANGGRISGATSPTLTITQTISSDTATYDVRVIGPGCFGSELVTTSTAGTITVIGNPACTADFNHDGAVNSQDFFDFLNAFFAGCP